MNISSIGLPPPSAGSNEPATPPSAQMRQLAGAVRNLNESGALPDNRELSLSFDSETKLPVVKIVDSSTREVIEQIPAEYILRITSFLQSEDAKEAPARKPEY